MAGVAGILFTEVMGINGKWYLHGDHEYAIPYVPLVAIMVSHKYMGVE